MQSQLVKEPTLSERVAAMTLKQVVDVWYAVAAGHITLTLEQHEVLNARFRTLMRGVYVFREPEPEQLTA